MLKTLLSFTGLAVSALIGATLFAASAHAGTCRVDPIDPMSWSESFGVSTCKARGPRYDVRDFTGEGARGYAQASSDDPMVWSDDQWRSDLMGGYADDAPSGYDNRFHRERHVEQRIVRKNIRIMMDDDAEIALAKRKGARMVSLDGKIRSNSDTTITRGAPGRCQGILVIRYGEGSRCLNRKAVPLAPRGKLKDVPKMG